MFVIYSLSRSRTYWLSKFLSYKGWHCAHNLRMRAPALQWLYGYLSAPNVGVADAGMIELWPVLNEQFPNHKRVVITRPRDQIKASFAKLGIDYEEPEHREKLLKTIASLPGTLVVSFDELKTKEGCKKVFEFCRGLQFDEYWWRVLKNTNLQCDVKDVMRTMIRNQHLITAVNAEAGV